MALAVPHPGAAPVRGVGLLHGVASLLRCDGTALRRVAADPRQAPTTTGCAGLAEQLAHPRHA